MSMTNALNLAGNVAMFVFGYLVLCLPGVGVLLFLRGRSDKSPLVRTATRALVWGLFFAPILVVIGHPVIAPALIGMVAVPFFEGGVFAPVNLVSPVIVMIIYVLVDRMRSNSTIERDARKSSARPSL